MTEWHSIRFRLFDNLAKPQREEPQFLATVPRIRHRTRDAFLSRPSRAMFSSLKYHWPLIPLFFPSCVTQLTLSNVRHIRGSPAGRRPLRVVLPGEAKCLCAIPLDWGFWAEHPFTVGPIGRRAATAFTLPARVVTPRRSSSARVTPSEAVTAHHLLRMQLRCRRRCCCFCQPSGVVIKKVLPRPPSSS